MIRIARDSPKRNISLFQNFTKAHAEPGLVVYMNKGHCLSDRDGGTKPLNPEKGGVSIPKHFSSYSTLILFQKFTVIRSGLSLLMGLGLGFQKS